MLAITEQEFNKLTEYMKSSYGINLTRKKTLVEGRLSNIVAEKGFTSFGDYLQHVFSDRTGEEIHTLINKLTTNHTYFMRESKHFDYFRTVVLPYLHDTVKDRDLRIWSAGCSSGEEPYTLQMIINDFLGKEAPAWDKRLLATDISTRALDIARAGVYSEEAVSGIPPAWKLNYFQKIEGDQVKVKDALRGEILFRSFNLMEPQFPFRRKFQTIFCRNVMIYFDQPTKMNLVQKFYDALEPGGYLFIGHSETIDRDATAFSYIMPAVYRKKPV